MKYIKQICLVLLAGLFFGTMGVQAESAMHIHQEDGYLSVDIQNMPLKNVLQSVQDKNGFWFRGEETLLDKKVSTRFDNVDLIQALRRILLNVNHAMVFDEKGDLEGIFITGVSLAENIDAMIMNSMPDSSIQDQSPPVRVVPGPSSNFSKKPGMPDDKYQNGRPSPSENKPEQDFLEEKGPGAGDPPAEFPDSGGKPKIGPGSEPSKIKGLPLRDKQGP